MPMSYQVEIKFYGHLMFNLAVDAYVKISLDLFSIFISIIIRKAQL